MISIYNKESIAKSILFNFGSERSDDRISNSCFNNALIDLYLPLNF